MSEVEAGSFLAFKKSKLCHGGVFFSSFLFLKISNQYMHFYNVENAFRIVSQKFLSRGMKYMRAKESWGTSFEIRFLRGVYINRSTNTETKIFTDVVLFAFFVVCLLERYGDMVWFTLLFTLIDLLFSLSFWGLWMKFRKNGYYAVASRLVISKTKTLIT